MNKIVFVLLCLLVIPAAIAAGDDAVGIKKQITSQNIQALTPSEVASAIEQGRISDMSVLPSEQLSATLKTSPTISKLLTDGDLARALQSDVSLLDESSLFEDFDTRARKDVGLLNGNAEVKKKWFSKNGITDDGAEVERYDGSTIKTKGSSSTKFNIHDHRGARVASDGKLILRDNTEISSAEVFIPENGLLHVRGGIADISNARNANLKIIDGTLKLREDAYASTGEFTAWQPFDDVTTLTGIEIRGINLATGKISSAVSGQVNLHANGKKTLGYDTSYTSYSDGEKSSQFIVDTPTEYSTKNNCDGTSSCIQEVDGVLRIVSKTPNPSGPTISKTTKGNSIVVKTFDDSIKKFTVDELDTRNTVLINHQGVVELAFSDAPVTMKGDINNLPAVVEGQWRADDGTLHAQRFGDGMYTQCSDPCYIVGHASEYAPRTVRSISVINEMRQASEEDLPALREKFTKTLDGDYELMRAEINSKIQTAGSVAEAGKLLSEYFPQAFSFADLSETAFYSSDTGKVSGMGTISREVATPAMEAQYDKLQKEVNSKVAAAKSYAEAREVFDKYGGELFMMGEWIDTPLYSGEKGYATLGTDLYTPIISVQYELLKKELKVKLDAATSHDEAKKIFDEYLPKALGAGNLADTPLYDADSGSVQGFGAIGSDVYTPLINKQYELLQKELTGKLAATLSYEESRKLLAEYLPKAIDVGEASENPLYNQDDRTIDGIGGIGVNVYTPAVDDQYFLLKNELKTKLATATTYEDSRRVFDEYMPKAIDVGTATDNPLYNADKGKVDGFRTINTEVYTLAVDDQYYLLRKELDAQLATAATSEDSAALVDNYLEKVDTVAELVSSPLYDTTSGKVSKFSAVYRDDARRELREKLSTAKTPSEVQAVIDEYSPPLKGFEAELRSDSTLRMSKLSKALTNFRNEYWGDARGVPATAQ